MKILFVADSRSPTALNWIRYFVDLGEEIHLASMFPSKVEFNLASYQVIPVVFSRVAKVGSNGEKKKVSFIGNLLRQIANPEVRTWIRHHFVPRTLPTTAKTLQSLIIKLQPDIIHAMRVPYEGMTAALAYKSLPKPRPPLVISIWGNDFTLHASSTRKMVRLTHLAMEYVDGLHTDCYRDLALAGNWGFNSQKKSIVLPGAGGIQLGTFYPNAGKRDPVVINPRGYRSYVRNDTFFQAVPSVLARHPQTLFICPAMEDQPEAVKWVNSLNISQAVQLLPHQTRTQMADLFRQAKVVVSPSTHDGTPNTILEAMACGSFPVVGDLQSIREWITPGVNGLLVDPGNPKALSDAICESLENQELLISARKKNLAMINKRAEYKTVMDRAGYFYRQLLG